jgi:hypothetical protein
MEDTGGRPRPLLVSGLELEELREKTDRTVSYQHLVARCIGYVLRHRRYGYTLSPEDGEDIVAQALIDELHCIADPLMRVEEVSARLKRALNRVRARYVREHGRTTQAQHPAVSCEDLMAAIELKEMARLLREHIARAFEALGDRDRDLLIDCYRLEQLGFVKKGLPLSFSTANAFKVALWRARQRFLTELERRLVSIQAYTGDPGLAGIVRVVEEMKPRATTHVQAPETSEGMVAR